MPIFELSTNLPRVEDARACIFRLTSPPTNRKSVLDVAACFGLQGDLKVGAMFEDARLMIYSEGSREVVVHRASGGVRYHDKPRWQVDDGTSNVEFDDATAIGMAQRFIEAGSIAPLGDCKALRVTHLNVGVAETRTKYAEQRVIDVGVAFTRVIDGIEVHGPGGKVMVYLDSQGGLTGADRIWREVGGVHVTDVPLRSPEEAQDEAVRQWKGSSSGCVIIDDVRFGYYEQGWDVSQRYLQPAYIVSASVVATEGHSTGSVVARSQYVAAAALNSPEKLVPRRPPVPPQRSRQRDTVGTSK